MNYLRSLLHGFGGTPTRHRIYAQVRYSAELHPLLALSSTKNVPLILNFSAPWCGTCHVQTPLVLQALEELDGRLDYVEIKADEPEMSEFILRFGVRTFPTLVSIRREFMAGDLPIRSDMSKDEIKRFLEDQAALGAKDRGE
ncbi:protein of unknown function [Taphrina deformans PYCC 5710]|uniref:Thioredoxin domain-containing protein n=1 Tax=Taphrina deformans (strain PYCC 5710 / ATCC 11124 / CBS 356.35 / IMI 108563 / JCM 9778 / NBRC 8474) TaxID=1097556 RepID=R4XIC9_TAPDE|nr:protein of unknown function [Taphrina deformans PYCC 5710]|eukprot:CCG84259.1 protein of unknown function [Taphrina deformans PYCC 5710]